MADIGAYILDENNNPVPEPDTLKWAEWFETAGEKRIVAQDRFDGYFVSTVFLALDNSFGGHIPMLWETMVWKDDADIYLDRHSTYEYALKAHREVVERIKNREPLE